jgi:hypothetical protein
MSNSYTVTLLSVGGLPKITCITVAAEGIVAATFAAF